MRLLFLGLVCFFTNSFSCIGQCESLVIEKAFESNAGVTYRIYAVMKSEKDMVLAVFGDSTNVLTISSTQPFYQNRYGGSLSTHIKRNMLEVRDSLKYDSWLTIGRTDNYDNKLMTLGLNTTAFENKGGSIICSDGAWYCLPIDEQSWCDNKKQVLLMQLTTKGELSGIISLMGKTAAGKNYESRAMKFDSKP